MATVIDVPVKMGGNGPRGGGYGAMVDEDDGHDHLGELQAVLAAEAKACGKIEDIPAWLPKATSQTLALYAKGWQEWQKKPGDAVGYAYYAQLPLTDVEVRMTERRILRNYKLPAFTQKEVEAEV